MCFGGLSGEGTDRKERTPCAFAFGGSHGGECVVPFEDSLFGWDWVVSGVGVWGRGDAQVGIGDSACGWEGEWVR